MVHNKTSVHFRHFAEHIFARLIKKYHFKLGKLVQECKVLYPMISTDFPQLVCVKSWKIVERFISQLSVKKCRICLPTAKILADFKHDQLTSSSPLLTVVEIVKNRPKWSKSSLNGSHDTREHKVRRSGRSHEIRSIYREQHWCFCAPVIHGCERCPIMISNRSKGLLRQIGARVDFLPKA